jgi:hypothetical protein
MNDQNGIALDGIPPLRIQNPIIKVLEDLLANAKMGQLDSLAIVAVNSVGGIAPIIVGGRKGDMYAGVGMLSTLLLNSMMNPQQSRILPVRG